MQYTQLVFFTLLTLVYSFSLLYYFGTLLFYKIDVDTINRYEEYVIMKCRNAHYFEVWIIQIYYINVTIYLDIINIYFTESLTLPFGSF